MTTIIDAHIAKVMANAEKLAAFLAGTPAIVRLTIEEVRVGVLKELFDQYGYEFIPSVAVVENLLTYSEKLLINGKPSDEYYFEIATDAMNAQFKVKMSIHEETFINFLYQVDRVNRRMVVDKLIEEVLSHVPVNIDGITPPEIEEDDSEKILSGRLLQIKKIEPMKSRLLYSVDTVDGDNLTFAGNAQYFDTAVPGDFISAMKGDIKLIKKDRLN